jgi:hypothetical protein
MTEQDFRIKGCLTGWKEIGAYFGVHADTVRRWHKMRKMPIRRLPGGTPSAFPEELKKWVEVRSKYNPNTM